MPSSRAPLPSLAEITLRLRAAGCVYAEEEAELLLGASDDAEQLERMLQRRSDGTPLELLLGWAQFCGLRLAVGEGVFVPRRRTELLAREAITAIRATAADGVGAAPAGTVVVELCCGVAAVAAAILDAHENGLIGAIELHASDIDPAALAIASRNLGAKAELHRGDLYDALPAGIRGRVSVLLANAPYVPSEQIEWMPREAREHEPLHALDGEVDGVALHRRLAAGAPGWLAPGGLLLVETSRRQAPLTAGVMREAGLAVRISSDEEIDATVVVARR